MASSLVGQLNCFIREQNGNSRVQCAVFSVYKDSCQAIKIGGNKRTRMESGENRAGFLIDGTIKPKGTESIA
jgi:hypothetical protein